MLMDSSDVRDMLLVGMLECSTEKIAKNFSDTRRCFDTSCKKQKKNENVAEIL